MGYFWVIGNIHFKTFDIFCQFLCFKNMYQYAFSLIVKEKGHFSGIVANAGYISIRKLYFSQSTR